MTGVILTCLLTSGVACVSAPQPVVLAADTSAEQKLIETSIDRAREVPGADSHLSATDQARVQSLIDGASVCNDSLRATTEKANACGVNLDRVRSEIATLTADLNALKAKHRFDWIEDIGSGFRHIFYGALLLLLTEILIGLGIKFGKFSAGMVRP